MTNDTQAQSARISTDQPNGELIDSVEPFVGSHSMRCRRPMKSGTGDWSGECNHTECSAEDNKHQILVKR